MPVDVYNKILTRVERRLNTSPRLVILNALLFTIFSTIFGFQSVLTGTHAVNGTIDGVVYWAIFFWSVIVCGHASFAYLNSGAWRRAREKHVQEEILDAEDIFDLDTDDMIQLHLEISEDIQQRSQVFKRLLLSTLGYAAMWPGALMVMLILRWSPDFTNLFHAVLLFSLTGTLLLGFTLPVRQLFKRSQKQVKSLSSIYGYKRKRKRVQAANSRNSSELLGKIGDDGEFVVNDTVADQKLRSKANL